MDRAATVNESKVGYLGVQLKPGSSDLILIRHYKPNGDTNDSAEFPVKELQRLFSGENTRLMLGDDDEDGRCAPHKIGVPLLIAGLIASGLNIGAKIRVDELTSNCSLIVNSTTHVAASIEQYSGYATFAAFVIALIVLLWADNSRVPNVDQV